MQYNHLHQYKSPLRVICQETKARLLLNLYKQLFYHPFNVSFFKKSSSFWLLGNMIFAWYDFIKGQLVDIKDNQ